MSLPKWVRRKYFQLIILSLFSNGRIIRAKRPFECDAHERRKILHNLVCKLVCWFKSFQLPKERFSLQRIKSNKNR